MRETGVNDVNVNVPPDEERMIEAGAGIIPISFKNNSSPCA
jgi:hypothetical protein